MPEPTYTDPWLVDVARAVAIGLIVAGAAATLLFGGELLAGRVSAEGVGAALVLVGGVCMLLGARARSARLWAANRAYLLSEKAASIVPARRARERVALRVGRLLLTVFLIAGLVFFWLFTAISCGQATDGLCGKVGRPPEAVVVAAQVVAVVLGCAWASTVAWRRRHDDETERIDLIVAEGQRRRRADDPLAGTDRASWE